VKTNQINQLDDRENHLICDIDDKLKTYNHLFEKSA